MAKITDFSSPTTRLYDLACPGLRANRDKGLPYLKNYVLKCADIATKRDPELYKGYNERSLLRRVERGFGNDGH